MREKYLVILAIMVIGTAIAVGFVLWSNRNLPAETLTKIQKAANPCLGLSAGPGEITCAEAKEIALADTPGDIKDIEIGFFKFNPVLAKILGITEKEMWLIDIELSVPFVAPNKTEVKILRIGVPLDRSESMYRAPAETQK